MDNAKQAKDLVNILREANQEVDPKLADLAKIAAANINSGKLLINILFIYFYCSLVKRINPTFENRTRKVWNWALWF
jgi:hypothetical protein